MRYSLFALALAACLTATTVQAQAELSNLTCSSSAEVSASVSWPETDPVWTFDMVRPSATDTGTSTRGTGLEIRDVHYMGRKVFERAHSPILNVEYDPGAGCGCYRDWQDSEVGYAADGVLPGAFDCFAQATAGVVQTTCELPEGGDAGSFTGIALEDYGDELVITAHMSASWYRYRVKWHFYADGRIWPEYSFAAASAACTDAAHRHHAYWRFDFDLEGTPGNDVVREFGPTGETVFTEEADRTWGAPTDGVYWSVTDEDAGVGYLIEPSSEDLRLPVDDFSKTDALVLRYKMDEIADGITIGTGCEFEYDNQNWVNGESLDGEDIVFWYRSSALHTAGNPWECDVVGPTLRPQGYLVSNEPDAAAMRPVEVQAAAPNPSSSTSTVRFRVAAEQTVRATLLDALGREVSVLFDGAVRADRYETLYIDGSDLPAGTYVVRVDGERGTASTRISIVR